MLSMELGGPVDKRTTTACSPRDAYGCLDQVPCSLLDIGRDEVHVVSIWTSSTHLYNGEWNKKLGLGILAL